MKEKLREELKVLTSMISVDGSEQEIGKYLYDRLQKVCDSVEVSPRGVVIGRIKGKQDGNKVMLSAHCDEIGFIVKNILSDGFIKFEKVGDYSDSVMAARKILIQTDKGVIPGLIGQRASHIMTADERSRVQPSKNLYIDVGASSGEEVRAMGVKLGDKCVLQSDFMEMANRDLVCTRALDDKTGCAILLNVAENIDRNLLKGELFIVFTVCEETTIAGLNAIVNVKKPDCVLVLDTVPCGDVPDVNTEVELPVYMNRGPVLIIAMGEPWVEKYSQIHPRMREAFYGIADEMGFRFQELVISENGYLTDEIGLLQAGFGTAAATLAIPRRYSHTPVELLNLNDAVKTYDVVKRFVEKCGDMKLNFFG